MPRQARLDREKSAADAAAALAEARHEAKEIIQSAQKVAEDTREAGDRRTPDKELERLRGQGHSRDRGREAAGPRRDLALAGRRPEPWRRPATSSARRWATSGNGASSSQFLHDVQATPKAEFRLMARLSTGPPGGTRRRPSRSPLRDGTARPPGGASSTLPRPSSPIRGLADVIGKPLDPHDGPRGCRPRRLGKRPQPSPS